MKVFKFGGASLKNAKGIENVASIILSQPTNNLLVVVSAIGKTTDLLERILTLSGTKQEFSQTLTSLKKYHYEIIDALFQDPSIVLQEVNKIFDGLENELAMEVDPDQIYDQVVSQGELISSIILHHYLLTFNASSHWVDARTCIQTDKNFREGKVDWTKTSANIQPLKTFLSKSIIITQGFIGKTEDGLTTTLGREGSDFSAAIFASSLECRIRYHLERCSGCDEC